MPVKLLHSINPCLFFITSNELITFIKPIITLINNTVGVAALAMPFCFHQCGILLSFLFLGITAAFSIMSCDALIDICSTHRVLPFEHACFKALGYMGKNLAELSVTVLLFGYVVGYYVTIADLSSGVVSQFIVNIPIHRLRFALLVIFTITLIPLCLMARMQSLIRLNVFTCLFYGVVTFHMIFILGLPRLISNMPWEELNWWKPAGLIECIPIFLASMFCQTQLHVTSTKCFQPTSSNMRFIVRVALVTVAIVYGFFGFFGYVAFINSQRTTLFSGNIFLMYPDDLRSYCIRIGFLLTNIVSIPLIIWPLRQTVYNLCCQKRFTSFGVDLEMNSSPMFTDEIPRRFMQKITIALLLISFLLSLTTDKIEVIIRYTTSIAGSLTGFILPALVLLVATTTTSASSASTTLTATSNNSSNHHDHDHHHKYSIIGGGSSGRISVLPRFLQFNRTQSIGAYCLLFVGCLLFSLEFFSVHPIDINNNNDNALNTLPIQSKFYPTHTTTNYNHHSSSINSPNDQSVQMRMMIASNSKILQPTTNHMKHPPSSIPMDQSKLPRETIDSASAQNHEFTMSPILNETRVKKEH